MSTTIDINYFISNYVTERVTSFFEPDLHENQHQLNKEIENSTILVIGGAGTIGSSFIKAILKYHPKKLVVVDTNENGLTELTRDLRSSLIQVPNEYLTYPMDFGSKVFEHMFNFHGPFDIVANFAAHKHVRSEKDFFSISAMIENNVFKAKVLLDLLKKNPPKHFFCVSTDKAANPVNVMGASKKVMEELILSYAKYFKVTTARFANVAFSNGSLLQGFCDRLSKKQPISCPSDIKRFFVSPQESGEICLLACVLGESGDIFYPKFREDEQVFFAKILNDFFKYLGIETKIFDDEQKAKEYALHMKKDDFYPLYYFSSDTSGEKTYEEFFTETDELDSDKFNSLGIIKNKINTLSINENGFKELKEVIEKADAKKEEVVKVLTSLLNDFNHIETGKSLDEKM